MANTKMKWRVGYHLLFENKVAKITKIFDDGKIIMRCFGRSNTGEGNSKSGYDWQLNTDKPKLDKLYQQNKVKVIRSRDVLEVLFANYEGCMPIEDMRNMG